MDFSKMSWKWAAAAVLACAGICALALFVPIYPCGYWDAGHLYEDGYFAGYGYHSLAEVLGNGFFWSSESVPVPDPTFAGSAPFFAVGKWYISLLYVPIFLAAGYLGLEIALGNVRMPTPSTSSGRSPERTPLFRRSR